jgi:hypothetical protein
MNIMEVVQNLYRLNQEHTIYAKEPWHAGSEAAVVMEPSDSLVPKPLGEKGFSYFLDVSIAGEFLADLPHVEPWLTLEQRCNRLISYAVNDA